MSAVLQFKQRVRDWSTKLRAVPAQIVVRDMSRKWASCSSKGRITFAREVLELSMPLQDYIIVHELLHLRHPNHGRVFRSLLQARLPCWRDLHTRLARKSPLREKQRRRR